MDSRHLSEAQRCRCAAATWGGAGRVIAPVWRCTGWGLRSGASPCRRPCPHCTFTLLVAVMSRLARFFFRLALSVGFPRLGVIPHPALRCPDFPQAAVRRRFRGCWPASPVYGNGTGGPGPSRAQPGADGSPGGQRRSPSCSPIGRRRACAGVALPALRAPSEHARHERPAPRPRRSAAVHARTARPASTCGRRDRCATASPRFGAGCGSGATGAQRQPWRGALLGWRLAAPCSSAFSAAGYAAAQPHPPATPSLRHRAALASGRVLGDVRRVARRTQAPPGIGLRPPLCGFIGQDGLVEPPPVTRNGIGCRCRSASPAAARRGRPASPSRPAAAAGAARSPVAPACARAIRRTSARTRPDARRTRWRSDGVAGGCGCAAGRSRQPRRGAARCCEAPTRSAPRHGCRCAPGGARAAPRRPRPAAR